MDNLWIISHKCPQTYAVKSVKSVKLSIPLQLATGSHQDFARARTSHAYPPAPMPETFAQGCKQSESY